MKVGDVVHKHGEDNLMTVESFYRDVDSGMVVCVWFDKDDKLRKLRFYVTDLIVVAHDLGSMTK